MVVIEGTTLANNPEVLDGKEHRACEFRNCTLIYRGGQFSLIQCQLSGNTFQFEGAAWNTLDFLRCIYNNYPDGPETLETILDAIVRRRPGPARALGQAWQYR